MRRKGVLRARIFHFIASDWWKILKFTIVGMLSITVHLWALAVLVERRWPEWIATSAVFCVIALCQCFVHAAVTFGVGRNDPWKVKFTAAGLFLAGRVLALAANTAIFAVVLWTTVQFGAASPSLAQVVASALLVPVNYLYTSRVAFHWLTKNTR